MINLAFMGVYRESSGYGNAMRSYLKAFLRSGAKIAVRPIFFSTNVEECDKEIRNAESAMYGDYDAVFLGCPPYAYEVLDGSIPHLGTFFTETNPLPNSWSSYCELMAYVIHPSKAQRGWCNSPRFPANSVVGVPVDTDKYFKSYTKSTHINYDKFNFYTISDFTKRKNFEGLLRAYFYEFKDYENVVLNIKTSGTQEQARTFLGEVIAKCNLSRIPEVNIITGRLSEDEICSLHKWSDCFVCASHGEGWNLPAQDALLFGKSPIVPDFGGQKDFVTNNNGWLIPVIEEPCFGGGAVHAELFTGKRTWSTPSLVELASAMREAFSNKELREAKGEAGVDSAENFSYEVIGSKLIEAVKHAIKQKNEKGLQASGGSSSLL